MFSHTAGSAVKQPADVTSVPQIYITERRTIEEFTFIIHSSAGRGGPAVAPAARGKSQRAKSGPVHFVQLECALKDRLSNRAAADDSLHPTTLRLWQRPRPRPRLVRVGERLFATPSLSKNSDEERVDTPPYSGSVPTLARSQAQGHSGIAAAVQPSISSCRPLASAEPPSEAHSLKPDEPRA